MAQHDLSKIVDDNGDEYLIKAKGLEDQVQISLTGDVSGSATTDFTSDPSISTTIGTKKVTTSKIDDSAVTTDKINDKAVTLDKIADAAKGGAVQDNDGVLATHAQVKDYVDAIAAGEGKYRGVQTVATINSWTVANLNNGDRVITADEGTITFNGQSLAVVADQELVLWKDTSTSPVTAVWQTSEGNYKLKQTAKSDPTASGTTITAIDTISQNSNGDITATKKTIQSATTSQQGVVQLAGSIGATVSSENNKAASEKAVRDAINALNAFSALMASRTASEKAVRDAINALNVSNKADKVASATSGNFAGLDANGNLTDSGKKASDFATSEQGGKADSAIQGVKLDGAEDALVPDSGNVVTIPNAVATGTTGATNGLMTAADKQKLDSISATTTSVTVGSTTFNKYTDNEAKAAIGISSSGDSDKFLNEAGLFTKVPFEGLFEAVYGVTSYNDVLEAINSKKTVFCSITTSSGVRRAILAYATTSMVEFQYYRSRGTRTESDYSDEVYVYELRSTGWATTIRKAGITYAPGTNMSQSFDSATSTMTFNSLVTNVTLGQGYGTCATAEATAAKVVSLSNYDLVTGGIVAVKFTYGLCASATMNINSKGAKNIFINGAVATDATCKMVKARDIAYFIYDGTQYQFLGTDKAERKFDINYRSSDNALVFTKKFGTAS